MRLRSALLAAIVMTMTVSTVAHAADWPEVSGDLPTNNLGANDAAVIVGIGDYFALPDIQNANANAIDWNRYLQKVRGVPGANVRLLVDGEATKETITKAVQEAVKQVRPEGTLWFIYVGHGSPAPSHEDGLILGSDTQVSEDSLVARGVAQKDLLAIIDSGPQKDAVVLFDACFSGTTGDGKPLVPGSQATVPVKRIEASVGRSAILSASDVVAGPLRRHNRPAFSYIMLGAMRGWGDTNHDGTVTLVEAFDYSKDVMIRKVQGRQQVPSLRGNRTITLATGVSEAGPDLVEVAINDDRNGPFGGGTVSAPSLDVSKFAGGAFGDISIAVERARDDALDAAESTVATATKKRDAWCLFAGIEANNPYRDEASKQCSSWSAYVDADAKLVENLATDYGVLVDYLDLRRRTPDEKRRAVGQFVEIYGRYDDRQEVRAAKYAAKNMDEGRPAGITRDTDGDGILLDNCPDVAEDKDGDRDDDGCPDTSLIEAGGAVSEVFHFPALNFTYFRMDLGAGVGFGLWDQSGVPSKVSQATFHPLLGVSSRLTYAFVEAAVRYDFDMTRDFNDGGGHLTGEIGARIFGIGPWTPSVGLDYRNLFNLADQRGGGAGVYFANTFVWMPALSSRLSYRYGLTEPGKGVIPVHTVLFETSITFADPSGSAFFELLGEMCE